MVGVQKIDKPEPQCCGNCRFWLRQDGDWGRCRRYAPRPVVRDRTNPRTVPHIADWVNVRSSDWCGEWVSTVEAW